MSNLYTLCRSVGFLVQSVGLSVCRSVGLSIDSLTEPDRLGGTVGGGTAGGEMMGCVTAGGETAGGGEVGGGGRGRGSDGERRDGAVGDVVEVLGARSRCYAVKRRAQ